MIIIPLENETYDNYIQRILNIRENVKDEQEYREHHHILPKCMGGEDVDENLIWLYGQEHYYAHKLLALENPSNYKLQCAWWNMCHCRGSAKARDLQITPDEYAEARRRFSIYMKENYAGENAYWYRKKQSEESNKKRSLAEIGVKNPMYGKHHSEEARRKMSEKNMGKMTGADHPRAKPVKCIESGEVFPTAQAAARAYRLKSRSSITLSCRGDRNGAGHNKDTGELLHWEYYTSEIKINN